jgi:hypothetical protein
LRTLNFTVNGQIITYDDGEVTPVANSLNYINAHFAFNDEWDGLVKTSIWRKGDLEYTVLIGLEDTIENIGWLTAGEWEVSVFGGNLITVNTACVLVQPSGYDSGVVPPEPPEEIYNQIIGLVEDAVEIAEGVKHDAETGAFTPDITVEASVDDTVGTPSVEVTKTGSELEPTYSLAFSGLKGETGTFASATATVDDSTGIPNVAVTMGGDEQHKTIDFAFHNLKGEQGEKGETGNVNFATFEIDADGNLIATYPEDYSGATFRINEFGELEVLVA